MANISGRIQRSNHCFAGRTLRLTTGEESVLHTMYWQNAFNVVHHAMYCITVQIPNAIYCLFNVMDAGQG